jgi:hypothetical protein
LIDRTHGNERATAVAKELDQDLDPIKAAVNAIRSVVHLGAGRRRRVVQGLVIPLPSAAHRIALRIRD